MFSFRFLSVLLSSVSICKAVVLPPPPGPSNVTRVTGPLVDTSRLDPFAPTPTPRALMVSVFRPADCESVVPVEYMPNFTATYLTQNLATIGWPSNSSFTLLQQPVCPSNQCSTNKDAPIVLFSPGLGAPRLIYSAMAAAVSSYGYTVITIDHPYDDTLVEYPDGHVVYQSAGVNNANGTSSNATLIKDVEVRAQDCSFVLDQMANATAVANLIPDRGSKAYDVSKSLMFGHSLGGATAAQALLKDSRFAGGINLDGKFFGDVVSAGLNQPFMIMAAGNHTDDSSWIETWPLLKAFKLEVALARSRHRTYTDGALDLAAFGEEALAAASPYLSPIPGARVIEIVADYAAAFFNMVLSEQPSALLEGPSAQFPEVEFIRR